MEIVLQLIWDVWFAPLEVWVQTLTPEDIRALASTILIPMSKADVGNPGDWDLDTLEWAAREAADEGEIGGYVECAMLNPYANNMLMRIGWLVGVAGDVSTLMWRHAFGKLDASSSFQSPPLFHRRKQRNCV